MSELPKGWVAATVSDVVGADKNSLADGPYGSKLKSSHYTDSGVRVVRLGNIGRGRYLSSAEAFISREYFRELQKHEVREGDIVMAALGDPIGRCCLVPAHLLPAMVKADCFRIRLGVAIDPGFFVSWMNSEVAARHLSEQAHGVGRLRVNLTDLRRMHVPLPPLAEQKRIVTKLDVLNAKSACARTELARIETLVSRYKQVVLSKAFSELNTESRRLLGLTQFVTSGSRGWARYYSDTGPFFIRIGNTVRGAVGLDRSDIQRVTPPEGAEGIRTRVQSNDIVVTITADLGRIGLIGDDIGEAYVNQHLALLRLKDGRAAPLIAWYLVSEEGQSQLHKNNRGATRAGLGLDDIRQVAVPYPPLEEQHEIVRRIESAFAKIDRLAEEARRALDLVGKLDEAILAKAFRGELVPQDENDEPAHFLMERIRAEHEAGPKVKRGRGNNGG
ncbi:restriction endonuclease subunit S [Ensifer sp. 2TAB8]|uniref:restriction endonuclease subunit S n=1 Tax=Ensifer sp. 2TAB8 TaxID=3233006 RepID=UPI003F8EB233